MSQLELTARRMETGEEAAKGCEIFLCEQRIESNWRILLTIRPSLLLQFKLSPGRHPTGRALERENTYALAAAIRGASVAGVSLAAPFISFWPGLRMSMEPLNQA